MPFSNTRNRPRCHLFLDEVLTAVNIKRKHVWNVICSLVDVLFRLEVVHPTSDTVSSTLIGSIDFTNVLLSSTGYR